MPTRRCVLQALVAMSGAPLLHGPLPRPRGDHVQGPSGPRAAGPSVTNTFFEFDLQTFQAPRTIVEWAAEPTRVDTRSYVYLTVIGQKDTRIAIVLARDRNAAAGEVLRTDQTLDRDGAVTFEIPVTDALHAIGYASASVVSVKGLLMKGPGSIARFSDPFEGPRGVVQTAGGVPAALSLEYVNSWLPAAGDTHASTRHFVIPPLFRHRDKDVYPTVTRGPEPDVEETSPDGEFVKGLRIGEEVWRNHLEMVMTPEREQDRLERAIVEIIMRSSSGRSATLRLAVEPGPGDPAELRVAVQPGGPNPRTYYVRQNENIIVHPTAVQAPAPNGSTYVRVMLPAQELQEFFDASGVDDEISGQVTTAVPVLFAIRAYKEGKRPAAEGDT